MLVPIKVYSDYVCPYCILAKNALEKAASKYGLEVEYMPFELRPYPTPTLRPEDDYMQNDWKNRVYPIAKKLGIKIVMPPFSPQPYTHLAFEGFQFAKENGKAKEYNDQVYRAFFQESLNIGEIDVLGNIAEKVALNKKEFIHALKTRAYKEAHRKALHHAYFEAKIHVAPTFVIGNTVIKGMAYYETFEKIIQDEIKSTSVQDKTEGISCSIDGSCK